MAVYGRDYYGRAKYGSNPLAVAMAVDPFKADVIGFDSVSLSWSEPTGEWSGFRLLRNRNGFPIHENDGELVLEYPVGYSGATGGAYLDGNRQGGWYYYAIFLWNSGSSVWERAAALDVLVPFDFASTEKMWDLIPDYYKQVRDNGAGYDQRKYRINPAIYVNNEETVPNQVLGKFLHVLGWGMDTLRSQAEQTRDGYDVDKVHVNRLALLAQQFGGAVEDAAPANVNRSMVRNLGYLYRKRGTLEGIREMVSLATGWEVDVTLGPNLMLSEDQARFANPKPQMWDHTVKYKTGDRVRYGQHMFEALKDAYGKAQGPPITRVSNEWWDTDRFIEPLKDTTVARTDTGDISTWQIEGPGGFQSGGTWIGAASTDPEDGSIYYDNALAFRNETGTASADFTVRSVPRHKLNLASWDKRLVIESGIPVPRATKQWQSGKRYRAGDMVLYKGSLYEASGTTEALPTDTTSWKRLGYDERPRLCLSYYAHGPINGTVNTGGVKHHPVITQFDESGNFLLDTVANPASHANVYYDPFTDTGTLTSGRVPAKGAAWSANGVGTWGMGRDDVGGYVFPPVIADTLRNLIANPSFETNATGWGNWGGNDGASTFSRPTDGGKFGTAYARAVWTTASTSGGDIQYTGMLNGSISPGDVVSASVWVRCNVAKTVTLNVNFRDAAQASILGTSSAATALTPGVWTEIKVQNFGPAPANASSARLHVQPASSGGWAVGDQLDVDGAIMVKSSTVPAYFDGSTADNGAGTFYHWEGTAHASTSLRVSRSYQLAPATLADGNVAITYHAVPTTGRLLGLVFRWVDSRNFWIATQTGLYKVVNGARSNPASGALTWASLADGDRLRVSLSGSTIQVFKNGTSLGTATDAFNSTANRHGVEVES